LTTPYRSFLKGTEIEWGWKGDVKVPDGMQVVVCSVPLSAEQWQAIADLKKKYGARVVGIQELALQFTPLLLAQTKFDYFLKSIGEISPYYLGEKYFGPLEKLNELYPLEGKRVIEFGPFDGAQTAGLVHHKAGEIICIEARAENFIKTLVAKGVFGWQNVRLVMDDMHNTDMIKYGRFDLAFCHGTYYHSIAPFVLLENLVSLSDNVFVGGFVLKNDAKFEQVAYQGENYRVQPYLEAEGHFTAGVNKTSYFFHPDDLTKFFSIRGYKISVVDDESCDTATHRFYRFFASRS